MRKIEAIIRRQYLDKITEAFSVVGIEIESRPVSAPKIKVEGRAGSNVVEIVQWVKFECFCRDNQVDLAIQTISKTAKSGHGKEDGQITIMSVEETIRLYSPEPPARSVPKYMQRVPVGDPAPDKKN